MSGFKRIKIRRALSAAAVLAIAPVYASATTYTWTQTSGGPYDWNATSPSNWTTGFPNAVGDVVNLNTDLTAANVVYLRQDITVGYLNIGDSAGGAFAFTIGNYPGTAGPPVVPPDPAYTLTFDSGVVGTPSQINLGLVGNVLNTISTPVVFNSGLVINMGATTSLSSTNNQDVQFTGATFNAGANNVAIVGGFSTLGNPGASLSQVTIGTATDLIGSGTWTIGGQTQLNVQGTVTPTGITAKSFTGKVIASSTVNGTNAGSLGLVTGSLANASEIVLNGQFTGLGTNGTAVYGVVVTAGGAGQGNAGAVLQEGAGSNLTYIPGQRLTSNKLTFNGGTLNNVGAVTAGTTTQWVEDTINTIRLNSGESFISMGFSATTAGTRITGTTFERGEGATVQFRPSSTASNTPLVAGNGTTLLKSEVGGNAGLGVAGTPTVGIVPWMILGNSSGYSANTFATYDPTTVTVGSASTVVGFRALASTEFATVPTLDSNVRGSAVALTSDLSINSLQFTSSSATPSNIGAGRTLSIKSGGLALTGGAYNQFTGGIGASGNAAAGTIAFGSAEAVIFSTISSGSGGAFGHVIGAAITGSGGLTKSGFGQLTLTGANSITGKTHVGNGVLKVGDGTFNSSIGNGDVTVDDGAVLDLVYAGATSGSTINFINDAASLTLTNYGQLNGRLSVAAGIDTIAALYLGTLSMSPGYYGSTAAAAANPSLTVFTNDTFFLGNGLVQVVAVPEPSALGLLTLGALPLLKRKRW